MRRSFLLLLTLAIILLPAATYNEPPSLEPAIQPTIKKELTIDDWIRTCASINDLDENLVRAVILVESGWDPYAVSSAGAQGLMQIMPADWTYYFYARDEPIRLFNVKDDPFDPYANILAGTNALAIWRTVCQSRGYYEVADYLSCYNMGYNYFKSGNRSYANKVIAAYEEYAWE